MTISANNLVHWLVYSRLDRRQWTVLDRLIDGREVPPTYRFEVAYLIAIGCVEVEDWGPPITLRITEKGKEGHEFFTDWDWEVES